MANCFLYVLLSAALCVHLASISISTLRFATCRPIYEFVSRYKVKTARSFANEIKVVVCLCSAWYCLLYRASPLARSVQVACAFNAAITETRSKIPSIRVSARFSARAAALLRVSLAAATATRMPRTATEEEEGRGPEELVEAARAPLRNPTSITLLEDVSIILLDPVMPATIK